MDPYIIGKESIEKESELIDISIETKDERNRNDGSTKHFWGLV